MIPRFLSRSALALAAMALFGACASTSERDGSSMADANGHSLMRTASFHGAKANTGAVELSMDGGRVRLALTAAFVTPETPDPHWQIVDAEGRAFLLQRIDIKDMKSNRAIEVPAWIGSIAKVQIWCAFAETNLGEAEFSPPAMLAAAPAVRSSMVHGVVTSGPFAGPKADRGSVRASPQGGQLVLALSDDFVVPETPDPHWQVVDAAGRAYLLQRLPIKDGRVNRSIVVPAYVPEVVKVQIWCAFAEVNLGEAAFAAPVR